jgi:hypothetical protein
VKESEKFGGLFFWVCVYIFALFPMCQSIAISHNELHRMGFPDSNLNGVGWVFWA